MQKGFTLIETLVAITLVVLAITGSYAAAQNGVVTGLFTKDQVIAFFLAQEGIETVRNKRDVNAITAQNWLTGITAGVNPPCGSGPCKVDVTASPQITACTPLTENGIVKCNEMVRFDSFTNLYQHSQGSATRFRRTITITSLGPDEITVESRVDWSKGLVNRSFIAKEILMNWP